MRELDYVVGSEDPEQEPMLNVECRCVALGNFAPDRDGAGFKAGEAETQDYPNPTWPPIMAEIMEVKDQSQRVCPHIKS